jgi:hypothetical protein
LHRLRQCKNGNHTLIHWIDNGSYGGWYHCECGHNVLFVNKDR